MAFQKMTQNEGKEPERESERARNRMEMGTQIERARLIRNRRLEFRQRRNGERSIHSVDLSERARPRGGLARGEGRGSGTETTS